MSTGLRSQLVQVRLLPRTPRAHGEKDITRPSEGRIADSSSAERTKLSWRNRIAQRFPKPKVARSYLAESTAGNANRGTRAHTPRDNQKAHVLPPLSQAPLGEDVASYATRKGPTPLPATMSDEEAGDSHCLTSRCRRVRSPGLTPCLPSPTVEAPGLKIRPVRVRIPRQARRHGTPIW
jgi:hypothetical protein